MNTQLRPVGQFAEDLPYWNTGNSGPDVWIERTRGVLAKLGAKVTAEGFAAESDGRAGFLLQFELDGEVYRILWPVVGSRCKSTQSERRQAATGLYHWAKAQALAVAVLGARASFLPFLVLHDGSVAGALGSERLAKMLPASIARAALTEGR